MTRCAMTILLVVALSWLCVPVRGSLHEDDVQSNRLGQDSLTVSLITCWPGPEIYELYGHEAIRVRNVGMDSVWNFGIFDFREPNFVYRFVKGDASYMVCGYPFQWFLPEYISRGSRVEEQVLDLTQDEAARVLSMLQTVSLPENRKYHYNYVKNNCATRIYELLDSAVGAKVLYPDSVSYGTYRNELRSYNRNYPWYQLGIDLVLGSGIDRPIDSRGEMFVPVEMNRNVSSGVFPDGRKLIKSTVVLNEGIGDVTLGPTPWYAAPGLWSIVLFLLAAGISAISIKRKKILTLFYSLWYIALGLGGCVVFFLVFFSSHEATSPNLHLLWLNPVELILGIILWFKAMRPLSVALTSIVSVASIGVLIIWPFQMQSGGFSIFPIVAGTLILSVTYTILTYKKSSIKKDKHKESTCS